MLWYRAASILKVAVFAVLLSIYPLIALGQSANLISLQVDGDIVEFTETSGIPYISSEGRTMLPVRICSDAIGCSVDWNQEKQTVSVSKAGTNVIIPIGSTSISVNGHPQTIDAPALVKNGRTYLPLRPIYEAFGYGVNWNNETKTVFATSLGVNNINGGSTGIFLRNQLGFSGFSGIEAQVTLPYVTLAEKGDCPYVYFGFDWQNDIGNAEGGFQFIEDAAHAGYNKWTVFLRQGQSWITGNNQYLEQGSTHQLRFFAQPNRPGSIDLVITLDGNEVARKPADRMDFENASTKAVVSMAMTKVFDGTNCDCQSKGAKIESLKVRKFGSEIYTNFTDYPLYSKWNPSVGKSGMRYGTSLCTPLYVHMDSPGNVSIYKQ